MFLMYFHLIITDDCNLCCSYCRAKVFEDTDEAGWGAPEIGIDDRLPADLAVDLGQLYGFLSQDPGVTLTFYGGEPLIRADLIEQIVNTAPVKRFMLQTNGLLLHQLDPAVTNRFATILVSLDGKESLTDANRGEGVYRAVMENIRDLRSNGFTGELIARMTVTERTDIVDEVRFLAENPDHSFSSIHWQLDANFTHDFSRRRFREWAEQSYNPGICTLAGEWVRQMEETGTVRRWYPFLDPMEDLLKKRDSLLRCGAGHANYAIMTDGHIAPCPVMIGMSGYYVGHIAESCPTGLPRVEIAGECLSCDIRAFCGGRCLYAAIMQPWEPAARQIVCGTVRNLHDVLTGVLPSVQALIAEGAITRADFAHEKFNGCEIIP
jgi:putative peptide-modifying radical SAM enzyme